MSRSPDSAAVQQPKADYVNGWQLLFKMLREGRSFSGRERNCCFLNTGGPRFADVSGTTGFDFPDDARGLATVDWDFDGDLDVWLTNRTAPRVRYLCNDGKNNGTFVAFRLQGTTSNRDGIGARLEVTPEGRLDSSKSASPTKLIRTLHAGEGFISQSSKWLHFGLGPVKTLAKVTVRWHGGQVQEFGPLAVGKFYRLIEGRTAAQPVFVPQVTPALAPSDDDAYVAAQSVARIIEPGRPEMPRASYVTSDGESVLLCTKRDRPVLISLWGSWCPSCIEELKELAAQSKALRAANIDVVAINVDTLDPSADPKSSERLLQEIAFPFAIGRATQALATVLNAVQKGIINKSQPLGLPSSFLLDSQYRLVVVYFGRMEIQQLIRDVALTAANDDQLRNAAAGGRGRWATEPYTLRPVQAAITRRFIEAGALEAAENYIKQTNVRDANVFAQLAAVHTENQTWRKAIDRQKEGVQNASPASRSRFLAPLHLYISSLSAPDE